MKVWILVHSWDYEGSSVEGVYDTEAKANLQMDAEIADYKKRYGRKMIGESYDVQDWEVQ